MKVNINKNEIKLVHLLLSILSSNSELMYQLNSANHLCFGMSEPETQSTIKTLDKKLAQQLNLKRYTA